MQTQARRMSSTAITFPSSSSIAAVGTPATRTRVGKYELGNTLGEGSFAKVKYATNLDSGESVAIKIIDRDRILRHKMVEGIKREISTMKLIKHPNVLRIFEVLASKTKIYIVLEYANGGELFDKIARHGRLKEDEARGYFQQLINAVDYCHSRGVYHRDLKPENLLLDSFGILKVSDFGLSALPKQVREDGLLHTACGTPNYVAPEVLADKGYNGTSADVWSCGVILFVLMAGYLPFDEPNLTVLYRRIQKASFAFPSWFSSSSKKLIKRILDPNPVTRITIPEILKNDWFKKGYKPPHFQPDEDVTLDDVDAVFNDSEIKLQGDQTGRKGRLSVATEVFEVAPSLHMVQLRKTGGDTLEFHKFYKNLNSGLKDIVWTTEQSNNEEPKVA
ncbi:PREDICTED: CBL-interacting serine/threonine-protein kinase 23 isoform X6 [Ipomoea nil]|uniref:CBL-interacting serine/threonine-protein kinase 23 isoform X6 n=1 Tax=Ipomoea nil TaxID=35883 RepID=UPI000901C050|nr:PREDICTED: CBL-interacting serine/threonine-protein kinase 23 isoform X6 [Ipomoea nil]